MTRISWMSGSISAHIMLMAGAAIAQLQHQRIDVSKLGPQIGQQVPEFSLKDQTGKTWTRDSIMGTKGSMLVLAGELVTVL